MADTNRHGDESLGARVEKLRYEGHRVARLAQVQLSRQLLRDTQGHWGTCRMASSGTHLKELLELVVLEVAVGHGRHGLVCIALCDM